VETTLVPFHDDVIEAMYDHQTAIIYIVCRRVAENLGLEWSSQLRALRQQAVFAKYLTHVHINTSQGVVEAICLPLKYLPSWLFGIQANRVRADIRAKLLLYQEECADVLARYFLGDGVVVNPEEPVHSTLDIIEGLTKSQLLLIQEVRRTSHLTDAHSQELVRLDNVKVDKDEFDRRMLLQSGKEALRRWHAQRKFPDWVKEWMWAHAGGRCLNPACRRELDPSLQAPRQKRPQYDHVLSKEDGGMGTIDNCQLLCAECNNAKRGMYVDHRPRDLREQAEKLAAERQAERAREEEKRRRQQDFGFWP
jgi:5-methylcytosine-specific restriction endonuclease McrA